MTWNKVKLAIVNRNQLQFDKNPTINVKKKPREPNRTFLL